MRFDRHAGRLRDGAQRAGKLRVRAARIGSLDRPDGRGRIAHHMHLRAEGQHLQFVLVAQLRSHPGGFPLGAREAIAIPHAEGIIDREHGQLGAARQRRQTRLQERAGKSEGQ